MASASPPPSSLPWLMVGRAWTDGGRPPAWSTWVAPLGNGGRHALYRTLLLGAGEIVVTVELDPSNPSGARLVHRGRCPVPSDDAGHVHGRMLAMLAEADAAAVRVVAGMSCPGPPPAAAPGRPDDTDGRVRERAYLLWEQAGRPEGRAGEFWTRARREEARPGA